MRVSDVIEAEARVLFQGDSITDAGRVRADDTAMGSGYANMAAAWLQAAEPGAGWTFLNRGISGNRVYDLEGRWEEDCVALAPDWLSILIGVNDTWRRFDSNLPSPIEDFEASYRRILDVAMAACAPRLVILEPFLLTSREGYSAWREDLDPRIAAVRRVSCDYGAIYVALDGAFAAAACQRPAEFWAADGVHPTQAGHALIAQQWISAVGAAQG